MTIEDPDNLVLLTLKTGEVRIALRPDLAPLHVARIKELAGEKFYDGHAFHRVIPEFMAQTGDPTGTGSGRSHLPMLKAEFSPEHHLRGTVSMARAGDQLVNHAAKFQWMYNDNVKVPMVVRAPMAMEPARANRNPKTMWSTPSSWTSKTRRKK